MSLRDFLLEPLQGKTSLTKVFWLYGVVGSLVVSAVGLVFDPGNEFAMKADILVGLLFSVYVTAATYLCADNCASRSLARFVRFSAVIALLLLPVLAYWEFTGVLDQALSGISSSSGIPF